MEIAKAWPNKPANLGRNLYRSSRLIAFVFLAFFWFLTAFRSIEIGNDTAEYVTLFQTISSVGVLWTSRIEIGFQYYCLLLSKISQDPHMFLVITASICYVFTGLYAFMYSKNILMSVCLIFCMCFSIYCTMIRQDLAMMLVLFAYQLLKKRKTILAVILIVLAGSFHNTAYIALLLILYNIIPVSKKTILCIAIAFIAMSISGMATNLLSSLLSWLNLDYFSRYLFNIYSKSGWLAVTWNIAISATFYFLVSFSYEFHPNDRNKKLILSVFSLQLILNCLGYSMNMMSRIGEYFTLIAIVELPNALFTDNMERKKEWRLVICFIMLLYFIIAQVFRPEWNHLYPYHFWA